MVEISDKEYQKLQSRLKELEASIAERKRAEADLAESELKYRNLTENSLEGIGISHGDRVVFANKALLEIFGYENLEKFEKVSILEHIAPEFREMMQERIRKRKSLEPVEPKFGYRIIRKDGTVRDLEISTAEIIIRGEKCTQSTFRDVTERKLAEEMLRENVEKYRSLFENSLEAIALVDSKGNVVDANKRIFDVTGYSPEEIIGTNSSRLPFLPDESRALTMKNFARHAAGVQLPPYEVNFVTKNGEKRVGLLYATSFKKEIGPGISEIVMVVDITERKRVEEALKEHIDEL
ncbi:MAG: PAS domain S-box protein, partial [Candidatus Saganbacteria bacterium]|nr:PAS domain S-box protein [Candidatus Saganbacteria bacterium]